MAPIMHTQRVREFHCAWCSTLCFGWGDHISRDCVVVVAAATGPWHAPSCERAAACTGQTPWAPGVRPLWRSCAVARGAG